MARSLRGVTVAVLAADGFEQIEVTRPIRALRREGAVVRVVSLRPGRLRGMNFLWRGRKLAVDQTVGDADPAEYAALLLPGGFVNPDLLRQSEGARSFVQQMDRLGRPIAVICHGPELLISAKLIAGRHLTSWPGIADDVRNAGGTWEDAEVVHDRNWVSSRSPMDLRAFERAMVDLFAKLAPRQLAKPGRPVRWVAGLSRAGTWAGGLALGLAARRAWAGRHTLRRMYTARSRPRRSLQLVGDVVHDLSLAAAFGGIVFAKLALDPAARVLPRPVDRGKMITAPWKIFVFVSGASLSAALATWLTGDRPRAVERAPGLAHGKDALLAASVVTGAINTAAGLRLARAEAVPMTSGARPSPAAGRLARVHRTGLLSGYAHLLALAGTIAINAVIARSARLLR